MLRVYIAESLVDGKLIQDRLESDGIPAELFNQNGSAGLGELPVSYPEVWIRRDLDWDKATHIIQSVFEQQSEPRMLRCPRCQENNPDTFEICWLCQSALPAV